MKNLSISILFMITFLVCYTNAQTNDDSSIGKVFTKIGNALSGKSKILIKDIYSMGTLKSKTGGMMAINVIVVYEPGKEAERLRGLNIILTNGVTPEKSYNVYIDNDEVDNFIRSVVYFIQVASSWKYSTKDSSEVSYTTKDNLRLGFFQRGMEQVCFAECGMSTKIISLFDIEELNTIKLTLDKAKNVLAVK